jgi:hypothetical protein
MQEALVAEAAAAYDGLQLAGQLGATKIILESDSSVLVNALNSTCMDRSVIAGLCFKVCFTHREANSLADKCVKEVTMEYPSVCWLNGIPPWLEEEGACRDRHRGP